MKNGPYILIKAPAFYPGKRYRGKYAYEHHIVYWQNHGIVPNKNEVVHHKDDNKHNNIIDNLELISRKAHSSHHKRPIAYIYLKCCYTECGIIFKKQKRIFDFVKKNRINFYCCRSHQAKEQWRKVRSASIG